MASGATAGGAPTIADPSIAPNPLQLQVEVTPTPRDTRALAEVVAHINRMGNDDHRRRKTPCGFCMAVFKWIPVLFITAVIAWSYYAYVVELCIRNSENRIGMIFMLLFYHLFLTLFMWSYWRTIMTSVGRIPDQWRIPDEEVSRLFRADSPDTQKRILNNFARDLPVTNRTMNGSVRFCEKCKIIKPDRAHHCSVCSCCVLKMDHHCPWVNNCVNFYNYKYFVLFLGYALVYCLYVAFTSLHDFVEFWKVGAVSFRFVSTLATTLNARCMRRPVS